MPGRQTTAARERAGDRTPSSANLLVDFANSVDHDEGTDDLTTPRELSRWLIARGLLERGITADADDLALALELRAALHGALVANHDGTPGSDDLSRVAARFPLILDGRGLAPTLRPLDGGIRGALGLLIVAVHSCVADGTWPRLKICSDDTCEWAFYDASKNRSRAWCEWGCGNRNKTRAYRARQRTARE